MSEKIVTETTMVVKKYYPKVRVLKKISVKSVADIAKESKLNESYLYGILRGKKPWNLNIDTHAKAYELMEDRCRIIDEAMKDEG